MSFSGKVVLVTGAASGIGRETAKHFAKRGAALAIVDKDELNSAEAECRDNGAKDVLQVRADFRNQLQVEDVVDKVVEKYKCLDILINNAGRCRTGDLLTSSVEDFDLLFTVNVRAMYILTQKAMSHLVASKGNVVNVSSMTGIHPVPGMLLYSMCKAAIDQFTKLVAREYAPKGVRVNSVNPAYVNNTNIFSNRMEFRRLHTHGNCNERLTNKSPDDSFRSYASNYIHVSFAGYIYYKNVYKIGNPLLAIEQTFVGHRTRGREIGKLPRKHDRIPPAWKTGCNGRRCKSHSLFSI